MPELPDKDGTSRMSREFKAAKRFLLSALLIFAGACSFAVCADALGDSGFYGSGVQFDALNNAQVAEADVDYRFRAAASGAVKSFLWYGAFGKNRDRFSCDGYACGTGGTVKEGRIEIQGDKRAEVAKILAEAGFRPVFAGG